MRDKDLSMKVMLPNAAELITEGLTKCIMQNMVKQSPERTDDKSRTESEASIWQAPDTRRSSSWKI